MEIKNDMALYTFISSFDDIKIAFRNEYDFKNLEKEVKNLEKVLGIIRSD